MKRLAHKALNAVKNPKKVAKLSAKQLYILFRFGPFEYSDYLRRAVSRHMFIHNFPNGIRTSLDKKKAKNWFLLNKKPITIILLNNSEQDVLSWAGAVNRQIDCHFLVDTKTSNQLRGFDGVEVTAITELDKSQPSFYRIKQYIHRKHRGNDVILLDLKNPLIEPFDIIRLQHALYSYDDDLEIGFVVPAYEYSGEVVAGFDYDRMHQKWQKSGITETDYGQVAIPRYTLTASVHGLYISGETIQKLSVQLDAFEGSFDEQIQIFVTKGWQQNIRTLTFSPVILNTLTLPKPQNNTMISHWLNDRHITNDKGDIKVIYVLNATSVSGGIRVIFEHANGLIQRGFDVEIWSLQGQPTWTDLDVEVKKFRTYSDLLLSLRNEDAIKVATWWETDQIVWLASVNNGIPVNFIQEFETWFYPSDYTAQAAVVSSYRKEFIYMTTAEYQQGELKNIGIDAPIIPVGYESKYYYEMDTIQRDENTILALGRSFFQKNFAMTVRAWEKLGVNRPNIVLFGGEPDILKGDKVIYHLKPTNEAVNRLYNEATCFIQTSRHEGFSLPIIEAMAAGCPVITTDSHGNRGFCHDEKNCLVVDHDNDEQLADAIKRLLGDKELQKKFRTEGLKTAKQYEWALIFDKLGNFYKNLQN